MGFDEDFARLFEHTSSLLIDTLLHLLHHVVHVLLFALIDGPELYPSVLAYMRVRQDEVVLLRLSK